MYKRKVGGGVFGCFSAKMDVRARGLVFLYGRCVYMCVEAVAYTDLTRPTNGLV